MRHKPPKPGKKTAPQPKRDTQKDELTSEALDKAKGGLIPAVKPAN